jgi:hypothetical protein
MEYYIHNFTIRKGVNYWGLIFGTSHTRGMEKFLRVCWNEDKYSGESNLNIDDDYIPGDLFFTGETTKKKELIKNEIRNGILSGTIKTNTEGLRFALKKRCLPDLFVDVVQEMEKEQLISCLPKFNRQASSIHKAVEYRIEVIKK